MFMRKRMLWATMSMSQLSTLASHIQLLKAYFVGDLQAEFEAEQEKLKQLSYLSAAEQKKFADRQSIAFMYMKPPGYDAAQKRTEQVCVQRRDLPISRLVVCQCRCFLVSAWVLQLNLS